MKSQNTSLSDSDAVFLGWQEMLSGKGIPLFNITKEGHPQNGSTVTEKVLHDLNLKIPKRSRYRSMRKSFNTQKKCGGGEKNMKDKWEFYKDAENQWRWRRTAPNGNIVGAATEGYSNKADCVGNARRNGWKSKT